MPCAIFWAPSCLTLGAINEVAASNDQSSVAVVGLWRQRAQSAWISWRTCVFFSCGPSPNATRRGRSGICAKITLLVVELGHNHSTDKKSTNGGTSLSRVTHPMHGPVGALSNPHSCGTMTTRRGCAQGSVKISLLDVNSAWSHPNDLSWVTSQLEPQIARTPVKNAGGKKAGLIAFLG